MTDTIKKTRKPRSMKPENLYDQIDKQLLEDKVKIFGYLKESIENDRKKLNEQLALITDNVK